MPILPSPKNPLAILKGFRDELEQRTNITNFDRDSKVRAISDTLTDEVLQQREEIIQSFHSGQMSTASGLQLDELGEAMGLPRRNPKFGSTLKSEQNLAFYVESGDFGTINGGGAIPLTAGSVIQTDPDNNELNTTIKYTLDTSYVLPSTSTIFFVAATASDIGSRSNVGAEVLRRHNFTGYTDVASNSLKVVNFYPILNGTDRESDDSYRYRLSQYYNTLMQTNDSRIRLQALLVPGVLQAKTMPGYYGIGTAAVSIMGAEFQTNDRMLRGVQEHLNAIHAPGFRTQAIPASQVLFDFVLEVRPSRSLSTTQKSRLDGEIRRAILNYYRRQPLGGTIDMKQLGKSIQQQTNNMISLDSVGSVDRLFKKTSIRKGFNGSTSDERSRLISNFYQLNSDEFATLGTLEINFI